LNLSLDGDAALALDVVESSTCSFISRRSSPLGGGRAAGSSAA
jgi:hypothetical protein